MDDVEIFNITNVNSPHTIRLLADFDIIFKSSNSENSSEIEEEEGRNLVLKIFLGIYGETFAANEDLSKKAMAALDGNQEFKNKKLAAVCFLRLLPHPKMRWLAENPWRPKIVGLIDSQLADGLYLGKNKQVEGLQAHEKIEKLREWVRDFEVNWFQSLNMLTSLEQLRSHRERLMRLLNGSLGRSIIAPFLPNGIETQLIELYKRVEIYLDKRDSLLVVDAYQSAKEQINKFIYLINGFNTCYGNSLSKGVGERLLELIDEDFSINQAVQPSKLILEIRDKKYPFHYVGNIVDFVFMIKNEGSGYSYETCLEIFCDDSIEFSLNEIEIGRLTPGETYPVEIASKVKGKCDEVDIIFELKWTDFDGKKRKEQFDFCLKAQKSDIDWENFSRSDPYSLEPVAFETDLVGRKEVLNRLIGTLTAANVGSSIILGQKRVGKTSIAKSLFSHLKSLNYLSVYLESGDYVEPDPKATLIRLGRLLCKEIKAEDQRINHLPMPNFEEALAPLAEYLQDAMKIIDNRPIIFILDEFDELPLDLYSRGSVGDAFFLTLRSISSRSKVGFVLVGGEKMVHIMDCQGEKLNKWGVHSVDYFSRDEDWADYKELIQRPVIDSLEFTENALIALHNVTAGNPYFTKLVCQFVIRISISKRDCHITTLEINKAVELSARETQRNMFQHFWDDGIFGKGEIANSKSIRRRKLLIAISDILFNKKLATQKMIQEHSLVKNLIGVQSELDEFVTRKILVFNNGLYDFKVKLFQKWLERRGIHDIIATFSDVDFSLSEREKEERLKIKPEEVVRVIEQWKTYKGQTITEDKVRQWLDQFCGIREQRAIFNVLKGLKFYSNEFVRQKMNEVDGIVRRVTVRQVEKGRLKRSDILVSYLDSPAKSGSHFARLYADEAAIYVDNVIEKSCLLKALQEMTDIQALVFIDDFIGTGESASGYLKSLDVLISNIINERNIKVVFVCIVAFLDGVKHLEKSIEALNMHVNLHVCETLNASSKCFNDSSVTYPDPEERNFAKSIALKIGKSLEKKCPLGYGDLEMNVVFERSCPNNTLPILWSESTNPRWVPLFKRL